MYDAINAAVVESIERGVATSCSLMVPCPGAPAAMQVLRDRPTIAFGIHLTLVCDLPDHPWGPLMPRDRVPSLLDAAGEFFTPDQTDALLAQASIDEVALEFRAQIVRVLDAGLEPTHLDWHCLADGGRDDIRELTLALAAEFGLAVRIWLDPARTQLRGRGLPVTDHDFLDSFSLELADKQGAYAAKLRALPAGLNEWAVHPSLGDDRDGGTPVRRTDYDFLTSSLARELIEDEGITVLGYRSIQRAWADLGADREL